jgi:hypothetical protein
MASHPDVPFGKRLLLVERACEPSRAVQKILKPTVVASHPFAKNANGWGTELWVEQRWNRYKNWAFCCQSAPIFVENRPFSSGIRSFLISRFSRSGTKCAFSRTLKIFPETVF